MTNRIVISTVAKPQDELTLEPVSCILQIYCFVEWGNLAFEIIIRRAKSSIGVLDASIALRLHSVHFLLTAFVISGERSSRHDIKEPIKSLTNFPVPVLR